MINSDNFISLKVYIKRDQFNNIIFEITYKFTNWYEKGQFLLFLIMIFNLLLYYRAVLVHFDVSAVLKCLTLCSRYPSHIPMFHYTRNTLRNSVKTNIR